jgi:hypothetical protein
MVGTLEAGGTFLEEAGFVFWEHDTYPRFESAQQLELRFRALLTDCGTKRLELRPS